MSACESEAYETEASASAYESEELPPIERYPGWVTVLILVGGSVGSWTGIYFLGKALGLY